MGILFSQGGCVMCRMGIPIGTFSELRPGDHVAIRGQLCCLGLCYEHHAIVTRIQIREGDITTADIIVVDVDEKQMTCVWCACTRRACCSCSVCQTRESDSTTADITVDDVDQTCMACERRACCCWWFSCCKCKYPIKEHKLLDKTWQISSEGSRDPNVSTQQIRRIDYKKRKNDTLTTKNVARQFCQLADDHTTEYCVLLQNCEHFVSACVNGPETAKHATLKKTLSFQSYSCFWRIVYGIIWLLQAMFYALDFYVYATFVVEDTYFNIFPPGLNETISKICYNPNSCFAEFYTTCNWKFVGIFSLVFTIMFVFGQLLFYQPLYNEGFICRLCLITARLECFSKILSLLLIEAMSMYLEDPIYYQITTYDTKNIAALCIIVLISIIGAFLIYSISSIISWVLGMCCIPSCRGAFQFTKFFKFRGVACLVAYVIRKVRTCFLDCRRRRWTGRIN